jgi:hypothetical protein
MEEWHIGSWLFIAASVNKPFKDAGRPNGIPYNEEKHKVDNLIICILTS